jgi:hypothetical protein
MYLGILEHIVLRSADVKAILTILTFMEAIPLCLLLNKPHLCAPFIYQLRPWTLLLVWQYMFPLAVYVIIRGGLGPRVCEVSCIRTFNITYFV